MTEILRIQGIPMPWHCTSDHMTWPGCGRCGPCRENAPAIFRQAHGLKQRYDGLEAVLGKIAGIVGAEPGIHNIVKAIEELDRKGAL